MELSTENGEVRMRKREICCGYAHALPLPWLSQLSSSFRKHDRSHIMKLYYGQDIDSISGSETWGKLIVEIFSFLTSV
ncbi:unnamed protein product [Sphenostylis stenocarpa]|uniref:Uncharacterized protein n=1 Tax=Sphenostylis stenocarpa TaxID=92480 RepID=A0AA86RWW3_9FABA|nr:unnamed protein product [Sphenostylis stenocarpa]